MGENEVCTVGTSSTERRELHLCKYRLLLGALTNAIISASLPTHIIRNASLLYVLLYNPSIKHVISGYNN